MDLKQLEYITVIAEEHSISRAAERLFVSPSALSQYLKRLEETEHLPPLFHRRNRELLLTDAGRIYVNGALAILSLSKKLETAQAMSLTSLCVTVPPFLEYPFLTQCLPAFWKEFPDIRTEVLVLPAEAARKRLLDGQTQAAVLMEWSEGFPASLTSRPLKKSRIVLAASPAVADSQNSPETFSFLLPVSGTPWYRICRDICLQENLQPASFCRCNHFRACAHLLTAPPGPSPLAAFLPEEVFHEAAEKNSGVREIPLRRTYHFQFSFITLSGESEFRRPLDCLYHILSATIFSQ